MARRQQAVFPARLSALPETAAFAQLFCADNGVGHDDALRLTLIIEELFTNTVQHGYGGESDASIRVELEIRDGAVTMLYEDSAPRYEPTSAWRHAPANIEQDIEHRPVGGLGMHLVRELVSDARYAYENGTNRLWLTLRQGGNR
jgi:serine/threonine-protein kinase RsbW